MVNKYRIESDGKITRVFDMDTGLELTNVTSVVICQTAGEAMTAEITRLAIQPDIHVVGVDQRG